MFDVAIVGFGPTGAVLAGLLGQQGLKVWVGDESAEVYDKPRAISLDHEIMRVFQQLGLLEALEPYVEPFTNSEFYGVDGQLIKCMSTVAPPYPMTFTPSLVFSQPDFERVLRHKVQSMPNVSVQLTNGVTPGDMLSSFYCNTCVYDPKVLRVLRVRVGIDRLIMGSDYPVGEKDPVQWLRNTGLDGADLAAAAGGNAARLLGLSLEDEP
jgi:hypothetical protein